MSPAQTIALKTPEEVIDRLLTDWRFRLKSALRDNFEAVREKWVAYSGNPSNPSGGVLQEWLELLSEKEREEALAEILDVPFTGRDEIVRAAYEEMYQRVREQGQGSEKVFPVAAVGIGLNTLTGLFGSIGGGRRQREAQEEAERIAREARNEAQRSATNTKFYLIAGGVAVAVLLVVVILYKLAR